MDCLCLKKVKRGMVINMKNLYEAIRPEGDLDLGAYESQVIEVIRNQVGTGQVLLALSGGVDSAVCAALLAKAIPGRLHCIFVDHGLMRKNEGEEVKAAFEGREINLICVDAEERFLTRLAGVTDPEMKRKIIGEEFIRVFEEEARKLQGVDFLAQGTIYPDVLESGTKDKAAIKSHHNVGGLPDSIDFAGLVEPLRGLFKGEVRNLGWQLGLPTGITERQPFPGPGLAVRCIGEVTKAKLDILREADAIFREEIYAQGSHADQYFAILADSRTVGVVGEARAYGYTIALRAIKTTDFMTAEYVPLPHDLLGRIAERITNEVPAVTRVVYDITNKPPATVEWE